MIGIVDYDAGNLRSVLKAFEYLGLPAKVLAAPADMQGASRIVVPGVGAFGAAVDKLDASGFRAPLTDWVAAGRPLLGICLGMQLFLDSSEETPGPRGLGIIPGGNRKFTAGKVPQIGWNRIAAAADEPLFTGLPAAAWFYFVHSYYAAPDDPSAVVATADYGISFPAALRRGSAVGVQFHPEKSGEAGLALLNNWGRS
ncbi:MAG TPA: imidazole glycerol phosphate synthase subunit HisH [bacterium]|nr:imidazole glycerol phosphate synthase subunit HisH [bacterium]